MGFLGTGELFISGVQGNKGQILRGTGKQRQYWGTGNIRKQFFDFWETGEQVNLFQGNKGTGTPLGGPHNCQLFSKLFISCQSRSPGFFKS